MEWLSNEILFYGGIALSAASLIGALVSLIVAKLRKNALEVKLTEEYGTRQSIRKR